MDIPIAANILGTAGAVCWSVQLFPQIVINYRKHDTTGLQPTMMLLWASAGIPLGVYNIVENFNVALRIQPQILTFLSLVTWSQCKYYGSKWPVYKTAAVIFPLMAVMGGIEVGLIFALRKGQSEGLSWPISLMAILSACFLCAGVLRHYWDIYQERTVRGISFIFVAIDAMGDLTSLLSVFFQPQLDILGIVIYASELVLWLGVFACGGYFNFRPWIKAKYMKRLERPERQPELELNQTTPDNATTSAIERRTSSQSNMSSQSRSVFRTASLRSQDEE